MIRRQHILVKGHKWEYLRFGGGRPIVLIQGFTSSARFFEPLGKILSKNFDVIIPDLPGFGYTKSLSHNGYQELTENLELFLKELKIENPTLFGVSFGGMLALYIASRANIQAIKVFANSPWWRADVLGHGLVENFEREVVSMSDKIIRKFQKRFFISLLLKYIDLTCPDRQRNLFKFVMGHYRLRIIKLLTKIDIRANQEIYKSFQNIDLTPEYMKIICPVVLLGADLDNVITADKTKELQKFIPNATYFELKGVDHSAIVEDPHQIADIILENC